MDSRADGTELQRLRHEVGAELERAESSADPVDADEPEVEPYETRLRSLRDAVEAMEQHEAGRVQS